MARAPGRRLAFRELGTCLGVRCWTGGGELATTASEGVESDAEMAAADVLAFLGEVSRRAHGGGPRDPFSRVMYAAALGPWW